MRHHAFSFPRAEAEDDSSFRQQLVPIKNVSDSHEGALMSERVKTIKTVPYSENAVGVVRHHAFSFPRAKAEDDKECDSMSAASFRLE